MVHPRMGGGPHHHRRLDHSTEQSGLFGYLLPRITEATGIGVKVVAVGTGQALDIGRRGDADVVFVHDRVAEDKFMSEGQGVKRYDVMYNDFVIVGPKADPRIFRATRTSPMPCARSPQQRRPSSRAATAPARTRPSCGCGRSPASMWRPPRATGTARSARAWGLRSTWRRRRTPICCRTAAPGCRSRTRASSPILTEGDKRLFNQYGVMLVNPEKHPTVKAKDGQAFVDWLISPKGQETIADYKVGGEQLFFPNASH